MASVPGDPAERGKEGPDERRGEERAGEASGGAIALGGRTREVATVVCKGSLQTQSPGQWGQHSRCNWEPSKEKTLCLDTAASAWGAEEGPGKSVPGRRGPLPEHSVSYLCPL